MFTEFNPFTGQGDIPISSTRYTHFLIDGSFEGQYVTIGKEDRRVGNHWTICDHPNCRIVEIDQNTEKSSEDLRRLTITQTLLKDIQLMLVGKTLKREKK